MSSSRFTVAHDVLANLGLEVYAIRSRLNLRQRDVEVEVELPEGLVGRLERREVRQLSVDATARLLTWLDRAHHRRTRGT